MIGLWFCYRDDASMLLESVGAFRDTFGESAIVCLCDDGKAPLPAESLAAIPFDHYERTDWERIDNILGWESVLGILEFQIRMARKYGGLGAVKVDCDTLILSDDWLDLEVDLCGFDAGIEGYAFGHARFLSHQLARDLKAHILGRPIRHTHPVSEDQAIFCQAAKIGASMMISDWPRFMVGWQFAAEDDASRINKSVITFGNRRMSAKHGDPREVATNEMRRVRQWRRSH